MHTVTANDVKCKPSYFVEKSQSWVEGEKGRTISGTEIDRLKKKYNSSDMSNEKNVDFLGELVNLGVLSKATARYIYYGFAPIDIRSENVGNSQGFLQKDSGDTKMIATTGWTSSSRGYDYYEALFEQVKNVTTVDQKESLYLKDYSNYLRVLGRLYR